MKKGKLSFWLASIFIGLTLAACQTTAVQVAPTNIAVPTQTISNASAVLAPTALAPTVPATTIPQAVATLPADDLTINATDIVPIELNGASIAANNAGVQVNGATATITAAGTYQLQGKLTDGQIIVDTDDAEPVKLVLNGVNLANSKSAPLFINNAAKAIILLADNSENFISDASEYVYENADQDEPNAALFSDTDLTIAGNGTLTVQANFNDGIASKDGLVIDGGNISVTAADDGIRGKDYLVVQNGALTVKAGGDALKADNDEDAAKGYISIENGEFNLTAGGDGMAAESNVTIAAGKFTLTTGGGSGAQLGEDDSAKGIKTGAQLVIDGGVFTIDAADDALHSNDALTINNGEITIATGDDAIHADRTLEINAGKIDITQSREGIEGMVITINGGDIQVVSSDDGINAVDPDAGDSNARPGGRNQDFSAYTGQVFLYIHGGNIAVDAAGDGLDANGAIQMTNGLVIVNGPTERMNGAIDFDAAFNITGGTLIAAGSSGMAQTAGDSASQNSILVYFGKTLPGGTLIHIQNRAGKNVLTFAPSKDFQSLAFSSPELARGETYTIYAGGSATGTATHGLYADGAYTPGAEFATFTISQPITVIGTGGRP
ncbi:carbohydrate-binding domain-containing protein [Anaerolineae bacterium CFX7]|nr:carbohydrate-binding domain-containing protein [Anaerolineae bacterium CFX7]